MINKDYSQFKNLNFEGFKKLARDDSLSCYEKIGFPDSYRRGKEEFIFEDIKRKLSNLNQKGKLVIDIGPGCSKLPLMMIELCRQNRHSLILIDSQEMLRLLPDENFITKVPCYYPQSCEWLFNKYAGNVDVILTYSVFHYVFAESNVFDFIDKSLILLSENGEMLIGDIPNISKRKRFFNSPNGIRYHQNFMLTEEIPIVKFNKVEVGEIDDAIIISILQRCRTSGFDAYLLPQANELPMANRREDILIKKP